MSGIVIRCARCGRLLIKPTGEVNRARNAGAPLYCGRRCFGLARRCHKTKAQKVKEKRAYDIEYRKRNRAMLKAKKHTYFKRTYDPAKAAVERKKNMPRHVEYCRRPEYKKYKQQYDKQHRAKQYGPFAEAAMLVIDLNREIKQRMSNHEIKWQNNTANKRQFRAREDKSEDRSRPRNRYHRASHSTAFGA